MEKVGWRGALNIMYSNAKLEITVSRNRELGNKLWYTYKAVRL